MKNIGISPEKPYQSGSIAECFECLNSSLALTAPKLCLCKPHAIWLFWCKPLDLDWHWRC